MADSRAQGGFDDRPRGNRASRTNRRTDLGANPGRPQKAQRKISEFLKSVAQFVGFCIIVGGTFWVGYESGKLARKYPKPFTPKKQLVIEKVIDLQESVGARPDGIIGPETTRLVNEQSKKDKPEYFNKQAARYMTSSSAPEGE